MPVVVGESSATGEQQNRYRKPRNQQPFNPETDPFITQQSSRSKPTISALLLSPFSPTTTDNPVTIATATTKKKNFTSTTFRGLGCTASSQVSVPAAIRTSANWEGKKVRRKKKKVGGGPTNEVALLSSHNPQIVVPSSSSCLVGPEVWCGPGIGFTTDAASDCVVSTRRPVPGGGRGKLDSDRIHHRERSACTARRMVIPEDFSFFDADPETSHPRMDVFGSRHHRHARYRYPEGLAEIVMFQSSLLMGGRPDGLDRYRDWRLDVDSMSYEELLELGDKIGYVSTGLREDEIIRCLRKAKLPLLDDMSSHFSAEMQWKCSICQEEYEAEDEMGKLDCGHFFHVDCIKQWLVQKKTCPMCKTSVLSQK